MAAALAGAGHRGLLLNLDPQAHASLVLGMETRDGPCVGDAFGPRPKHRLDAVVVASSKRPGLFIAPESPPMAAMERKLFRRGHHLQAVPRALKTLSWTPNVILADTPPSIGAYTEAVLAFSDLCLEGESQMRG